MSLHEPQPLQVALCTPCQAYEASPSTQQLSSRWAQDLLHSIFLAEGSYKVVDLGVHGATDRTTDLYSAFPPQLLGLTNVTWSLPDVNHRSACWHGGSESGAAAHACATLCSSLPVDRY